MHFKLFKLMNLETKLNLLSQILHIVELMIVMEK